ncbi:MAG TPA: cysteine desulfurase family protein, partial [Candidatus Polarisedimenticolaceae bacterium]|nr:cysteine desulfurase family protein [Candidatus Polarisedimenticolaceae bacterium]
MTHAVYLDYNATTPVAPEVADAVDRANRELWGNPSSVHEYGRAARRAVEQAREQVARLLGCAADEIVFTSGGTESDNAAIFGVAEALGTRGRHLVISAVEHAAVDAACRSLEQRGYEVTRIGTDASGRVSAAEVEAALRPDTILVSLIHGQNETGVLQPVEEVGRIARSRAIVFHTDTAQSVGKLAVDVDRLPCDLATVAGHKLYGPKGVGALYVRRATPFRGLLRGAAHEAGRRSGTENVGGIVGLGVACELATRELPARTRHLAALRERLSARLCASVPDLVVHGAGAPRLPNTLSVAFPGATGAEVAARAAGVAVAAGAACHSGTAHVSRVLTAMGVSRELALATLRLSVGCPTTEDDVDAAAESIARA